MHDEQLRYYNGIEDTHWWNVARRKIIAALVQCVLPPSKDTTIADIGCGVGTITGALADDYTCTGFDQSETSVTLSAKRFPQARFIQDTLSDPPHPLIGSADLILLLDVIEHVEDDHAFIDMLGRGMKPGAQLMIAVPAHMSLWSKHDETVLHFRRYEEDSFRQLIEPLGFEVRLFSFFNTRLLPIIRLVRALNRWRGKTSGGSDTDFAIPPMPVNRLLEWIFAGEQRKLLRAMDTGKPGYTDGVSLIALLRKPA